MDRVCRPSTARRTAPPPSAPPVGRRPPRSRARSTIPASLALIGALLALLAGAALLHPVAAHAHAWGVRLVSAGSADNTSPDLDDEGRLLVYQGILGPERDSEIILYDLSRDEEVVLTRNDVADRAPQLDDGTVVWLSGDAAAETEVYLRRAGSGSATRLTDNRLADLHVRVEGDIVVWYSAAGPTDSEIFVHRVSTGDTRRLTTNAHPDSSPETDGHWVVWQAEPDDGLDTEIYLWDGHTVRRLTDNEYDDEDPLISNRVVVWEGYDGHDWEVYVAIGGTTVNLSDNSTGDGDPRVYSDDDGTWVAWRSDGELYLAGRKPGASVFGSPRHVTDVQVQDELGLDSRGLVWEVSDGFDPVFGRPKGVVMHSTLGGTVTQVFDGADRDEGFAYAGGRIAFPAASRESDRREMLVATKDTTDPTVAITAPADGTLLLDPVCTIRGTAHDDLAVERVEIDTGDGIWRTATIESGAGTGDATWRYDWTLPDEHNVTHTLRARATDGAGNQGTSTSDPTVRVGGLPAWVAFDDVPVGHPYRDAIYGMRAAGIIDGYEVGPGHWEFRPENRLWRAQFAKMICGTMGVAVEESMISPFDDLGPDVLDDLYPHEFVAAAYEHGFTYGISATLFAPYADITRAQVVTMLVRATLNLHPGELDMPPAGYAGTLGDFDPTHGPTMKIAEYNGLLEGLLGFGPSWDPWAPATRGETAQLLWNLMGELGMGA